MSTEENKALVRRSIDLIINQRDFAAIDQMYVSSYVRHDSNAPQVRSREDYKQYVTSLCTIFPDLYFTIDDLIGEDDKVVCRFRTHGTHSSTWRGLPATGKEVGSTGVAISRVVDGEIVEDWFINDIFSLAQQLGAIPAPR